MSIAITSTQNTMGVRRLSGYAIRSVWRGPAEPGPRAANHPVITMGSMEPPVNTLRHVVNFQNPVYHITAPAEPAIASSSSQPSQAPTGAVVSSYTDLNAQMSPSVASPLAPALHPTAVTGVAPSSQPGYVVVQGGGGVVGNVNPDYVGEIIAWLESNSLLGSISPGLVIPNWIPAIGVGLLFATLMGKRR